METENNITGLQGIHEALDTHASNSLTLKEFKSLKKHKYQEKSSNYKKSFILKNVKTGKIVEIKADTSYQASKMIGWKPKQSKVLQVIDNEKYNAINSSSKEILSENEKK
jgi:hypothetical protein